MRPVEIKPGIHWVGVVDWNKRKFHGYSLSPMGTTYNAFVIKDEQNVLVDTVDASCRGQFYCNLAQVLGDEKLDIIVANHLEPDHSGLLADVVEKYKPKKILTSPMGKKAMEAHFHHEDWPVEVVPTGSTVNIGKRDLHFVETRMLHWPDSMLTYVPQDKLAFSNDAFGQNWATSERFADEVDRPMLEKRMAEYYANIVLPYSPVVLKTLDALAEMDLDLDMVCPDHGLIWRGESEVAHVMNRYREFAEQKPANRAVVVYDTMWHSTEKMAEAVADGLADQGVSVRLMSMKANHHSDVMTEVFHAGGVAVGSPTHNNGILPGMADVLTYMKGLRPQNKVGAAFGSFGWSGECVKILTEWLNTLGFEVVNDPVKVKHVPTHDTFQQCFDLGKDMAAALQAKL